MCKFFSNRKRIFLNSFLISIGLGIVAYTGFLSKSVISSETNLLKELSGKSLEVSFSPNNKDMDDKKRLFGAINQNDIDEIENIPGVELVLPVNDDFNHMTGYAKLANKSAKINLKGFSERDFKKYRDNVKILHGRSLNASDENKNVIVLNNNILKSMGMTNSKNLIGTAVEINNILYEIIGVMDITLKNEREVYSELADLSLIPESTAKELARMGNTESNIYDSLSIELDEDVSIDLMESKIYDILYSNHQGVDGYYEKSVKENLSKSLNPTVEMLTMFKYSISVITSLSIVIAIFSLDKLRNRLRKIYDLESISVEYDNAEEDTSVSETNNSEEDVAFSKVKDEECILEPKLTSKKVSAVMVLSSIILTCSSFFICKYQFEGLLSNVIFEAYVISVTLTLLFSIIQIFKNRKENM